MVFGNLGEAQQKTRRKAKITYQFQPNVGDQKLVLLVLRERRRRSLSSSCDADDGREREKREGKLVRQLGDFPRIGW